MSEGSTRRAFQQMISALSYSHTSLRIVHRDLKPENVLLDDDLNVKIIEFGLGNEISDGDFLRTSCGSPNYAAPEVISGKLYAGPGIDVWSCGVILYVMLCGRLPFEDEHTPTLFRKISSGIYHVPSYVTPEAKSLIAGMLAVDPVKRLTVPEVLLHPWTRIDMPHYLVRVLPIVRPFMGALSSLVEEKPSRIITGIGKLDVGILDELSGTLNVSKEDLEGALKLEGENAVKVAYKLCRDRRRLGKDCKYRTCVLFVNCRFIRLVQ
jgi:carbon catabolite-derepressing protein kinase